MSLIFHSCLYCIFVSGFALKLQSGAAELGSSCCVSTGPVTRMPGHENIELVSWLASPWSNDGYRAMLQNRKQYAELHGYTFLELNEFTLPHALQDKWQTSGVSFKSLLLNHLLQHRSEGTWLVWTDADTIYTNWSKPWETYLDGDIVVAEAPDVVFNAGVFALRVSDLSRAFVQVWIDSYGCCGRLADNGAFVHAVLQRHMDMFNTSYDNSCKVNDFDQMTACYKIKFEDLIRKRGLQRSTGPHGMLGNTVHGTHINGVWGINSGIGFKPPNSWQHGDFILHFAGKGKKERESLAVTCTEFCQT